MRACSVMAESVPSVLLFVLLPLTMPLLPLFDSMQWAEFFKYFDVLLCPVMPTAAFEHDHDMSDGGASRRLVVNGQSTPYYASVRWAGAPRHLEMSQLPIGMSQGHHHDWHECLAVLARLACRAHHLCRPAEHGGPGRPDSGRAAGRGSDRRRPDCHSTAPPSPFSR